MPLQAHYGGILQEPGRVGKARKSVWVAAVLVLLTGIGIGGALRAWRDPLHVGGHVLFGPNCPRAVAIPWGGRASYVSNDGREREISVRARTPGTGPLGVDVREVALPSVRPGAEPEKLRVVIGTQVRRWGWLTVVSP